MVEEGRALLTIFPLCASCPGEEGQKAAWPCGKIGQGLTPTSASGIYVDTLTSFSAVSSSKNQMQRDLTRALGWSVHWPVHQKVARLMPGQGACGKQQIPIYLSTLSLSLPPSLPPYQINKNLSLSEDLKN